MKYPLVITLLFTCIIVNAQKMFPHEKEIDHKNLYISSDINFYNSDDQLLLSGTLIEPKTSYTKIVVIIAGSGKDTRFAHHKLTEEFLKQQIAVYRFDERGVGKSEGTYTHSLTYLTSDILFCIRQLKNRFSDKKIGLLGHSLGAMATILSTINSEIKVDFLIQLATPVKNFSSVSKYQITTYLHHKTSNKSTKETIQLLDTLVQITNKNYDASNLVIRKKGIEAIKIKGFQLKDIHFWSLDHINLFKQDFEYLYKKLQIPTFYVIGTNDRFINPVIEIRYLKKYNNPLVKIKVLKNLNHYLTLGTLDATVLYNIDKSATNAIMNWIQRI